MSYEEFGSAIERWVILRNVKGSDHPETAKALNEARSRLPEDFLTVLCAMGEMGGHFSVDMVADRTGMDPETVEEVLLNLEELGLVTNTERVTH